MKNSHPSIPRSGQPAAAGMSTDDESGAEGLPDAEDRRRALYALKVMHDRGLIPADEYARRVKELGGEG